MPELLKPKVRCLEQRERYGKFVVEPLERGYGTTLGNALRRVLLASLEGAAISSVKIEGIQHEFTTLKGVVEDCTEIILNFKELAIAFMNGTLDEPKTGRIEAKGEGEVTGADVQLPPGLHVVNHELHIATLTSRTASLHIELIVEKGKGYAPAEKRDRASLPIGQIPIDAMFAPIRRVNYFVEPTRVGYKSDFDRLTMEMWTNGTIEPNRALTEAARILDEHLHLFFDFIQREEDERKGEQSQVLRKDRVLDYRTDDLDFSVRTANCLRRGRIETLRDLIQHTEEDLLKIRNFGRKSLNEVLEKLSTFGLKLKESKPETEEPDDDLDADFEFSEV